VVVNSAYGLNVESGSICYFRAYQRNYRKNAITCRSCGASFNGRDLVGAQIPVARFKLALTRCALCVSPGTVEMFV
jgi:hypothetical protein